MQQVRRAQDKIDWSDITFVTVEAKSFVFLYKLISLQCGKNQLLLL